MDVFLCGRCRFSLNCQSGPEGLVRAFGRPSVNTNLTPTVLSHHLDDDLFLFKPIYQGARTDPLSYAEILAADLPIKLPGSPVPDADFYRAGGYRFVENQPDTLREAALEMHHQCRDGIGPAHPRHTLFQAASVTYQAKLETNEHARAVYLDQYAYAFGLGRPAASLGAEQPGFLAR